MKQALVAFAALAVVVTACQTSLTPAESGGPSKNVTYDVQIDASTTAFNIATVAYFPNELKAHPGDTIRFTSVDRGEPHTVTFGSLIDDAFAAIAKIPKDAPPGPPPSAVLKVPPALAGQLPNNVDFRQSAMQSCFLATGDPPTRDACSKDQQKQPEFTGSQTFFNSGFVPGRAVFAMKLSSNAKPGVYNFLCLFHGPGMTGKLAVVDAAEATPSPDEVKAKGIERLNGIVSALQPVVKDAQARAGATDVIAGAGELGIRDALGTDFFPKTTSVAVGGAVTWHIITGHTISFNAPADAVDFVVKATDGSFHLNNKSIFPVGWPGAPLPPFYGLDQPPGAPPPSPPQPDVVPPPFVADAGAWDGKGFRSSGIMYQFDPRQIVTYKVTFAQPGTYTYKCLIHVDMEGTVKVGG